MLLREYELSSSYIVIRAHAHTPHTQTDIYRACSLPHRERAKIVRLDKSILRKKKKKIINPCYIVTYVGAVKTPQLLSCCAISM